MQLLKVSNVSKGFLGENIIENVSFSLEKGEKIAIVGANGVGKSTLLNIINGDLEADSGNVQFISNPDVRFLRQKQEFSDDKKVRDIAFESFSDLIELENRMEEILKAENISERINEHHLLELEYSRLGGYTYRKRVESILKSFGVTEEMQNRKANTLSGGEITRVALSLAIIEQPDILILDEPTNHLDIETISWLEKYLKEYKKSVILVSHDRYFIDEIANRVLELSKSGIEEYSGNYSFYVKERSNRVLAKQREYEKYIKKVKKEEELIRKYKERGTEKLANRAKSREKLLDSLDVVEFDKSENRNIKFKFFEKFKSGEDVAHGENLSKEFLEIDDNSLRSYSNKIFENVNFDIKRGDRIAIVGANGVGKSTLLKSICGDMTLSGGKIKLGYNVNIGYYDQKQELFASGKDIITDILDEFPNFSDTDMRKYLGLFLFSKDDVFKSVDSLSGGEKARLSLLKVMLKGGNFLIMDEPTNHLDIWAKEAFEKALSYYDGTLLCVSHDRYFLNRVPNQIWEMTRDGVNQYLGGYDYYLEKRTPREEVPLEAKQKSFSSEKEKRIRQKEIEAERRRKIKLKEKVEEEIKVLEEEISTIEKEMEKPENVKDHNILIELSEELSKLQSSLDIKYEKWFGMD